MDEKKKKPDIPPNYVTLAQLQERFLKEQERKEKGKEELELQKEEREEIHKEEEEEAVVATVEGEKKEKTSRNKPKKKKKKKKKEQKTDGEQGKRGKEVGRELHAQGGGIGGVVEWEKGGGRERREVKMEYRPGRSDSAEIKNRVENSAGKVYGEVRRRFYGGSKGSRRDVGENEGKGEGLVRTVDGMTGNGVEMESGEVVGIGDVAGGSEATVAVERKKGKLGNERMGRWCWGNREMRKEFRVGRSEIEEKVNKREGLVGDGNGLEMEAGKSDQRVGFEDVNGENEGTVEIGKKLGDMSVESGNKGRGEVWGRFVSRGSGVYHGVGENGQKTVDGGRVDYRRYSSGEIESDMVENEDKVESLLGVVDEMDGNGMEMESGNAGKVDQMVGIEEVADGNEGTEEIELKLGEMVVESENGEMKGQGRLIRRGNGGYYGFRKNRQYGGGGGGLGYRRYGNGYGGYRRYGGGGGNFKNRNGPGHEQRGVDGNVKVWVKKEEVVHGGSSISGNCGQTMT